MYGTATGLLHEVEVVAWLHRGSHGPELEPEHDLVEGPPGPHRRR